MSNTLLMGWTRAVPGREKQALELFQSSLTYWGGKLQSGDIESFDPIFLHPHGGDMNGFFLIKGDTAKLDAIQQEKEYIKLTMQVGLALDGFGTIRGWHGDTMQELMGEWSQLVAQY